MQRLTRRDPDGVANFAGADFERVCAELTPDNREKVRAALEKLAAYEDAEQNGQRMCHIDALYTRAYEVFKRNYRLLTVFPTEKEAEAALKGGGV